MKLFLLTGAIALLGGCTAQQMANTVSGAQTACADASTGLVVVSAADPSLVSHNSAVIVKAQAACAAINATPIPAIANPAPAPSP